MRDRTIARNYAAALYEAGDRHGEVEAYARAFRDLTGALWTDPRVRRFLESPQLDAPTKQRAVRRALGRHVPDRLLRFVLVVIGKRRERLLPEIQEEYQALVDERAGRVRARVTLARQADPALEREIVSRLTGVLGRAVDAQFRVDPTILGGFVVRYGDRVLDGSLRRQLVALRREMLEAGLPELPAVSA